MIVESENPITRADFIFAGLSLLGWALIVVLVGPGGEFALNDDWAYSRATQRFLEIGLIERVAWTWVPAITHSFLGAAFASVLDLPFLEAVRWVGIVFGWLGIVGAYALFRCLGANPQLGAFAAATFGFNPLYLNLSFTYMTDVPFTACIIWSVVAYCVGARQRSTSWMALGTLLAVLATLTRQTGVAVPMTVAVALIMAAPRELRSWITAILINLTVFMVYSKLTALAYGPLDAATLFSAESVGIAVRGSHVHFHLVKNGLAHLAYLGCFIAPIALLCVRVETRFRLPLFGAAGLFSAACLALVSRLNLEMPPGINLIYNLGLGRRMLSDPPVVPATGEWIFWLLVAIGFFLGAIVLGACGLAALRRHHEIRLRPDLLIAIGLPIAFLGPHLLRAPCFDRYVLPVLAVVFAAVLALSQRDDVPPRRQWLAAGVSLLCIASFSLLGTRDYMEHHRARAEVIEALRDQGIHPHQISGGFEFNGLRSLKRRMNDEGVGWVYINDDEYVVTDRETLDGYELVGSSSFDRLMPPGRETIRAMHRVSDDAHSAQQQSGLVPAAKRRPVEAEAR